MNSKCKKHNLQEDMVCMGEMCHKRVSCELCIRKHDHKFYLDSKSKQIKISRLQQQLNEKLTHLQKYIKSNLGSLKLEKYKQQIEEMFSQEQMYFKTKIQEEKQNFLLWIQRTEKTATQTLKKLKQEIMTNFQIFYNKSLQYLEAETQYENLRKYFNDGPWTQNQHVQKGVHFLYSQEMLFKFNRNLDNLKRIIHFNKKENNYVFTWINNIRDKFPDFELCPEDTFKKFIKQYQEKPKISSYTFQQTKQSRDDEASPFQLIAQEKRALLIYPKQIYEEHHHIEKLKRLNNLMFATTGARGVNIWTKINLQPQKVYQTDYTTYGLTTFVQAGEQDSDKILFGKSNGQIGLINMQNQKVNLVKGHQFAVRDILQFDEYHFLTASQDWLIKIWVINDKNEKQFASQRGTLKGHSGKLHCMCKFGPNILAGGADGTIKLWDVDSQSFDEVFEHEKQVYTLTELRPQLFLSGGELNEIRLYDYRIPKTPAVKYPVEICCNSSLRYNENSFLYADRNIVKLIDFRKTKQPLLRYENRDTYSHAINGMDFLSDIEIGMGGSDNYVTIWKY